MLSRNKLCRKITDVFPDIGACGIDVNVDYDKNNAAWVVDLNKDDHHLKTFVETGEAEQCVIGKQCVALGLEIAQLQRNIKTA